MNKKKIPDRVFVLENVENGEWKFFDRANDAAMELNVTRQHMAFCKKKKIACNGYIVSGWKPRMYLIRIKVGKDWIYELCKVIKGEFQVVGKTQSISFDDAFAIKDISVPCYCWESL